jgi:hypothetical protein
MIGQRHKARDDPDELFRSGFAGGYARRRRRLHPRGLAVMAAVIIRPLPRQSLGVVPDARARPISGCPLSGSVVRL